MTEIGFYHLTRTGADVALRQLLGRTLAASQRAVVRCATPEQVTALNTALWEGEEFLPHGAAADGDAELQPIWLTAEDGNPNGARFLFLLDGAPAPPDGYDRVFDLFDGNEPARVEAARERWRAGKAAGHTLTYWQQTERGWEKRG